MLWSSLDLVHIFVSVFFTQLNSLHKARYGLTFRIVCARIHCVCQQRVRITHLWHRHKIVVTSQDHMRKQKKTTKAPSRQAKHIYRSPHLCCPSNCRCVPYFLANNTVEGATRTAENKNVNMCISLIECEQQQHTCKHRLFICSKSSSDFFHRDCFQRQKANT